MQRRNFLKTFLGLGGAFFGAALVPKAEQPIVATLEETIELPVVYSGYIDALPLVYSAGGANDALMTVGSTFWDDGRTIFVNSSRMSEIAKWSTGL